MNGNGSTATLVIRHGDDPEDDRIATWMRASGRATRTVRPFRGEALPQIDDGIDGLVIHGGGFDAFAHDRFPFLKDEARAIETALARGIAVMGICQGAQQIADVLGAAVGPSASGVTEFGYYTIEPVDADASFLPAPLVVAQSHFHGFSIPSGATRLARSALFENQAFSLGRALALQFHPEVTPDGFRRWQEAPWARYGEPGVQDRDAQDRLMAQHDAAQQDWFIGLLERHFSR
ncbi:MAG: type 1 glutamine amidotransferase [Rhizobiaceae bacterium]